MTGSERDRDIQLVFKNMSEINRRTNSRSRKLAASLSNVDYALLRFIADTPGARAIDVAEAFYLNRSTVSRQVGALLELGLARYGTEGGGRGKELELTEAGRRSLDASTAAHHEVVTQRLSSWSDQEIADFALALARYNQAEQS